MTRAHILLLEAARRWLTADDMERNKGLRHAWTGLGSATNYAAATRAGLMEVATRPNPGYSTWWRLTDAGAAIVQRWLDSGLCREHFVMSWTGAYALVQQGGLTLTVAGHDIITPTTEA